MAGGFKSILHIGMPKCMSTSVQTYLREAENVYFMGMGPSRFLTHEVVVAYQREIAGMPALFYNQNLVAQVFEQHLKNAAEQKAGLFAFSDESIAVSLGSTASSVSYVERLLRLKEVMPEGTTVLMIVRRPADYLRSTYKYRVLHSGVTQSYEEYLKRHLLLGDTNLLGTVKYYRFAEAARRLFGTIEVLAMEAILEDERILLRICDAPDLDDVVQGRLPRENAGIPDDRFASLRQIRAMLGGALTDDDFNVMSAADRVLAISDVDYYGSTLTSAFAKERIIQVIETLCKEMPPKADDTQFALSDETRERLADYVTESNALLETAFDVDTDRFRYDEF